MPRNPPLPIPPMSEKDIRRFWAKVEKTDQGCWLWTGALTCGYGAFGIGRKMYRAHRVAYTLQHGPIPGELDDMDHLCRVSRCCNPDHLEPVTHGENLRRGNWTSNGVRGREVTQCPKGHAYTPENTVRRPRGTRGCRTCQRAASLAWYYQKGPGSKVRRHQPPGDGTARESLPQPR